MSRGVAAKHRVGWRGVARCLARCLALTGGLGLPSTAAAAPLELAALTELGLHLESPEAWRAEELQSLLAVAAELPAAERALTLRRAVAPPLADDLTQPHQLVERTRRGLTLKLDGLDAQVEAWLRERPHSTQSVSAIADALLQRQLAHALTHVHDVEAGWSKEPRWRALSGWGLAPWGAPDEADALAYADAHGASSAAEDLATLGEFALTQTTLPGDPRLHPRCRVRSKWRWLHERLERPADTLDQRGCATLAEVGLDPEQVLGVELIYVEATSAHPASVGGHLMVGLVFADDIGERVDVYQLAALTGELRETSPVYVLRGLAGGFPSAVTRVSYWTILRRYEREDRSVRRLRLKLNPTQKLRFLERLDETRQGWDRPYLFFTQNCMHYPVELLEAAIGRSLTLPRVYGPDVFLARLARLDLLEPRPRDALEEFARSERAALASSLRRELLAELAQASPQHAEALAAAARDTDARRPQRRAQGYEALAALAPGLLQRDPLAAERLLRVLRLSEQVELATLSRESVEAEHPGLAALWRATALVSAAQASAAAASAASTASAAAATPTAPPLLSALSARDAAAPVAPGGSALADARSPRGRVTVLGGAAAPLSAPLAAPLSAPLSASGALAPELTASWALYRFYLGEPRAFSVPPNLSLQVLPVELGLRGERPIGALSVLEMTRLKGSGHLANPGLYTQVLRLESWDGLADARLTPLETGAALELLQRDAHRHHLGVSAGAGWTAAPFTDAGPRAHFDLALRAFGRLGAASQPLTGLRLEAELLSTPWRAEVPTRAAATLEGGLHLATIGGVDTAIAARYRAWTLGEAWSHGASLGLQWERH